MKKKLIVSTLLSSLLVLGGCSFKDVTKYTETGQSETTTTVEVRKEPKKDMSKNESIYTEYSEKIEKEYSKVSKEMLSEMKQAKDNMERTNIYVEKMEQLVDIYQEGEKLLNKEDKDYQEFYDKLVLSWETNVEKLVNDFEPLNLELKEKEKEKE